MKNLYLLFIVILLSSCSPKLKTSYSKLSSPEKTWVVFHVFKAKKAYQISLEAEKVKDSMTKVGNIGNDNNGGRLDAFKHSFWMARLTQGIGKRAAYSLGRAHEKGNYEAFKKRRLEDGFLPNKQSSDMDLFNNQVGVRIGYNNRKVLRPALIQKLLNASQRGELVILNKDSSGNFLDCQNKIIPLDSLKHKWNTKKCLVPSNKVSF